MAPKFFSKDKTKVCECFISLEEGSHKIKILSRACLEQLAAIANRNVPMKKGGAGQPSLIVDESSTVGFDAPLGVFETVLKKSFKLAFFDTHKRDRSMAANVLLGVEEWEIDCACKGTYTAKQTETKMRKSSEHLFSTSKKIGCNWRIRVLHLKKEQNFTIDSTAYSFKIGSYISQYPKESHINDHNVMSKENCLELSDEVEAGLDDEPIVLESFVVREKLMWNETEKYYKAHMSQRQAFNIIDEAYGDVVNVLRLDAKKLYSKIRNRANVSSVITTDCHTLIQNLIEIQRTTDKDLDFRYEVDVRR